MQGLSIHATARPAIHSSRRHARCGAAPRRSVFSPLPPLRRARPSAAAASSGSSSSDASPDSGRAPAVPGALEAVLRRFPHAVAAGACLALALSAGASAHAATAPQRAAAAAVPTVADMMAAPPQQQQQQLPLASTTIAGVTLPTSLPSAALVRYRVLQVRMRVPARSARPAPMRACMT